MQRVRPNRCGYSGYTCIGIPRLSAPYRGVYENCTETGEATPQLQKEINDYNHLPMKFAGFVSKIDTIYDMDKDNLAYPEKNCVTCVNIFEEAGTFFDMFAAYGPGVTYYWPGQPEYTGKFRDMLNFDPDYTVSSKIIDPNNPAVKTCETYVKFSDKSELLDNPLLDPLLETEFPPVSVDVIPAADHALDGAMFTLVQLTKWRIEVESILNELIEEMYINRRIRALVMSLDMNSTCGNFKITASNGNFIQEDDGRRQFSVSPGSAVINGFPVRANGLDNLKAPFKVFLNITFSNPDLSTGQYQSVTALLSTAAGGTISVQIGGATMAEGPGGLSAIRIQQTECDVVMDVIRTSKDGVLYRLGNGSSPYRVYETAPCPTKE